MHNGIAAREGECPPTKESVAPFALESDKDGPGIVGYLSLLIKASTRMERGDRHGGTSVGFKGLIMKKEGAWGFFFFFSLFFHWRDELVVYSWCTY